jgi:hypothetical protein
MENNNNYFGVVRWCEEDVADAIETQGFEPTEENVKTVMSELNEMALTAVMIQAGWDYLYSLVNEEL